jgi:hypothetical protein
MRKRSWTKEQLKEAVKNSLSIRQVLIKLKLREAGGNYFQIKKYIEEWGLNIAHLKGRGWNRGLTGFSSPRIALNKILIKNSHFQSFKLKKRLFLAGIKTPRCEECGWAQKSPDGRIPLEIDHVNGDSRDNRLDNLKILCPNCHSLRPTHRGKNRKK